MAKDQLSASLAKLKSEAPADIAKDKTFLTSAQALQKSIEAGDPKYQDKLKSLLKTVDTLKKSNKDKKEAQTYLANLEKTLKADESLRMKVGKTIVTKPS
jgi:hypothetical protein